MQNVKILCIYQPSRGGATIATKHFLKELKKERPNQIIIKTIRSKTEKWQKNRKPRLQVFKKIISLLLATKKTINLFDSEEIQAIYSPSILILFVCLISGKKGNLYYHYHGEHFQDWKKRIQNISFFVARLLYALPIYFCLSFIEKITIFYTKKIFVPSEYSRREIISLFPKICKNNVIVAPYGCDKKIFNPLNRHKASKYIHLFYCGRIDPNKGLSELIDALGIIDKKIKFKFTAAFLSTPLIDYKKELLKKLRKFGFNKIRVFWNSKPNKLASLYRDADLTLLPSRFEQLPLLFIESISCGTPVLSTAVGELTFLQPKISKKLLLKDSNPETIAKAVWEFAYLDPKTKNLIKNNCLKLSKSFSWQHSGKLIENVIFQ